ncbi:hypothetical protein ACGF12_30470 [Kitasatospora sp. NPDC048296]|uniref:hypothetical protein n=1 Tax=Kitasatospora sp. NPDC048296 TaxID=3364048 RepID=UPI00371E549E
MSATYTLHGRTVNRVDENGAQYGYTYPAKKFGSAMEMLHWATHSGLIRTFNGSERRDPMSIYLGSDRDQHRGSGCVASMGTHAITNEDRDAMKRAQDRMRELHHYFTETEPQWRNTQVIHYADNSVVQEQVNKHGRRREITLTPPHGDVCF